MNHDSNGKFTKGNKAASGRRKGLAALIQSKIGADGQDAVEFFLALAKADTASGILGAVPGGVEMKFRVKGWEWLVDRGFGKAPEVVEFNQPGEGDTDEEFAHMTAQERAEMLALWDKAAAIKAGAEKRVDH